MDAEFKADKAQLLAKLANQAQVTNLNDTKDFEERMRIMNITITKAALTHFG